MGPGEPCPSGTAVAGVGVFALGDGCVPGVDNTRGPAVDDARIRGDNDALGPDRDDCENREDCEGPDDRADPGDCEEPPVSTEFGGTAPPATICSGTCTPGTTTGDARGSTTEDG